MRTAWCYGLWLLGASFAAAQATPARVCDPVALAAAHTLAAPVAVLRLSDLLPACASIPIRQAATNVSLGYGPQPGSLRVVEGADIQRRVASIPALQTVLRIPARIWIYGAISDHKPSPTHPQILAAPVPNLPLPIHPGHLAILEIERGVMRLLLPVICLQPGSKGSVIRVRTVQDGKIFRAQVLDQNHVREVL